MKHANRLRDTATCLLRTAAACVLIATASALVSAQTHDRAVPAQPQSTQPAGSNADEDFELNIVMRHIVEGDFHAETAIETDGARGLQLKVGVVLGASEIDVLLRNVQGHVRFHGNLAPLLRLLDSRRGAAQPAQPPPENSP
ncbi:MAG: hypothetical protein QOE46_825 [Acidobacteriota bacterium]|nr:hypothetical protein [Acidobacteriota bacterium]